MTYNFVLGYREEKVDFQLTWSRAKEKMRTYLRNIPENAEIKANGVKTLANLILIPSSKSTEVLEKSEPTQAILSR